MRKWLFLLAGLLPLPAYAQAVSLADFESWTPAVLAARCHVEGGTNVRAALANTSGRMGRQDLRLAARIDRAHPQAASLAFRPERPVTGVGQVTFWYLAEGDAALNVRVEDSRGRHVTQRIGEGLNPNVWTAVTVPLRGALADVSVVRFLPDAALYRANGEYAFHIDDLQALPAESADATRVLAPVVNGGFEAITANDAAPQQWHFGISRDAKVSLAMDSTVTHSGKYSLRFHNESGQADNVYGRLTQNMPVLPSTRYRLTAWVRGKQVAGGQHFTDWKSYMLSVPAGSYDWQQISKEFETKPDQTSLDLGLNVVNLADALWVDDVRVEALATPLQSRRPGLRGAFFAPAMVEGDNQAMQARLFLNVPDGFRGQARLEIKAGKTTRLGGQQPITGSGLIALAADSGSEPVEKLEARVLVTDAAGKVAATGSQPIEKHSEKVVRAMLAQARTAFAALRKEMAAARAAGIPLDYPQVTATIAEHFIPWLEEDVSKGELQRAEWGAKEVVASLARARAEVAAYRKNPAAVPVVPRYQTGKVTIQDGSFIADTRDSRGHVGHGPVFFTGYGHFNAVRRDIEVFPAYGINLIQIEIGPSAVLTGENTVSTAGIEEVEKVLDRAAKAGVMVNVLLSPHYFPGWAMDKWPELKSCNGGFLRFCIDAPQSRQIIERYLRIIIPRLRGKAALHSLCLSNEPVWIQSDCPYTRKEWAEYLRQQYGTVDTLNAKLGARLTALDQAAIPPASAFEDPLFADWCVFNQRHFAAWHAWMADIVHSMAPEIPVHAKQMVNFLDRSTIACGTDPEQFESFSQIDGNDCWNSYPGSDGWAQGWLYQNIYYDVQRSMRWAPVFNSENHPIGDRSTHYYPPSHVHTVLWNGAIHGQGATTFWVWERTFDRKSDFYGNIMHRPASAEAVGRANLDLNRLAPEVTALQHAPAPAAILYSVRSIARDARYLETLKRIYTAMNFTGLRVAFLSEDQIARGDLKRFRWLVVPQASSVRAETLAAIDAFARNGGKVAAAGESPLANDECGRPHPANLVQAALKDALRLDADGPAQQNRDRFLAALGKDAPAVRPVDAATGKTAWGVEWRVSQLNGRTLVHLVNLTDKPLNLRLQRGAAAIAGRDLISGKALAKPFTMAPLEPMLVELAH